MNEYERLFLDDVREKKITATGAKHRASRGKRAITVHHHADYLTAKQRKELSSSVVAYRDYPLTRKEFKEMSKEEQKAYMEFIINKYNASAPKIAEMLGCSNSGAVVIIKDLGIETKRRIASKEEEKMWQEFLNKKNEPIEEPVVDAVEIEEPVNKVEPAETNAFNLSLFSSTASITLQSSNKETLKDEVARAISFVLPDGCRYKVTIEVL